MSMSSFDKSITILGVVFIIMFFSTFIVLRVCDAYENTPTNFTLKLETDNQSVQVFEEVRKIQEAGNLGTKVNCTYRIQQWDSDLQRFVQLDYYMKSNECYITN